MSRYETYKPSGVDWIGDVPDQWKRSRIKAVTDNLDGKRVPLNSEERFDVSGDIPYYGATGIVDFVNDFLFDEELVLIGEDGAPFFEPLKDVSFIIKGKSWVNNHAHVLRCYQKKISSKFLMHWLNVVDYANYIKGSTRDKLNQKDLSGIEIYRPEIFEQLAIAIYLDDQTQKIDRLIANKKAQAEKLKEMRQIEINNAVTKGLNPNAEMKDSGIEWLGRINKHYKLDTFKRVCKLKQGLQIDQELRFFETGVNRLPYITIKAINAGVEAENIEYIENADEGVICTPDEILLARTGATGEVVTGLHGVFHNNFFKIIYNRTILHKEFLVFYLNNSAVKSYLLLLAGTTTIPDLNHRAFFSAPIVLPEFNEQIEIANYLQQRTAAIDQLIRNIEAQIEKLQELRKIKIYEAVTGKIKVNAYAKTTT